MNNIASLPIHGGCHCGAIRYSCTSQPVVMFNCHCTDCQAASGGAFVTVAVVKEATLTINGEPTTYRVLGDTGRWTERHFCGDCGTPLFAKAEMAEGLISLKVGSLDDASWFQPQFDSWVCSKPDWVAVDQTLKQFERFPNK